MTKEQEEAIEILRIVKGDRKKLHVYQNTLKKSINIVLSMLEEKDKELQILKEFKEIANSKVTELNPIRISKGKSINK